MLVAQNEVDFLECQPRPEGLLEEEKVKTLQEAVQQR